MLQQQTKTTAIAQIKHKCKDAEHPEKKSMQQRRMRW
jgi:hypothetical protein